MNFYDSLRALLSEDNVAAVLVGRHGLERNLPSHLNRDQAEKGLCFIRPLRTFRALSRLNCAYNTTLTRVQ